MSKTRLSIDVLEVLDDIERDCLHLQRINQLSEFGEGELALIQIIREITFHT